MGWNHSNTICMLVSPDRTLTVWLIMMVFDSKRKILGKFPFPDYPKPISKVSPEAHSIGCIFGTLPLRPIRTEDDGNCNFRMQPPPWLIRSNKAIPGWEVTGQWLSIKADGFHLTSVADFKIATQLGAWKISPASTLSIASESFILTQSISSVPSGALSVKVRSVARYNWVGDSIIVVNGWTLPRSSQSLATIPNSSRNSRWAVERADSPFSIPPLVPLTAS